MGLNIYQLDPAKFLSAPGLALQAALKKKEVKLELLTDIDMLLMAEKGIIRGICNAIHWYAKVNNKYVKDDDKSKESSYLKYWDVNDLYEWIMLQRFPVNKFEWIEKTSQLNEDFINNYNEGRDEGCFLEVVVQYPEKLQEIIMTSHFFPERKNFKKQKSLLLIYMLKMNMSLR